MTTPQLRKSIAVMFISAFAVGTGFAAPAESPKPTASSAQPSKPQTARLKKDMPAKDMPTDRTASQTTRAMPLYRTQKASTSDVYVGRAEHKKEIAAINQNKHEHDAIVAAVKSKNASQIRAILREHGIHVAPRPPIVMEVNGFCYYYMCGDPPGPYCKQCVEVSHAGDIRD